jgi:CRISPR-associated protein Csb2
MSLTISLQFPTGKYVAAAWNDKDQPEWPPHPARLCLALLDVLHKSGNSTTERAALLQLCALGPPAISLPREVEISSQEGFFVPQNPTTFKGNDLRKPPLKPRSFPCVFLDADRPTIVFRWDETTLAPHTQEALASLLSKLPRFGHSSSLVIATLTELIDDDLLTLRPAKKTDHLTPDHVLRIPWDGIVESAETAFDAGGREAERVALVSKNEKKAKPGKPLSPSASPRGRHDPTHQWLGYHSEVAVHAHLSTWDRKILILERVAGSRIPGTSSWLVAQTLHKTILDRWSRDPSRGSIPEWISGHQPSHSGEKTPATSSIHLSIFGLPFIHQKVKHADGSLKGIGIAIPRASDIGIDPSEFRLQWHQLCQALFDGEEPLILNTTQASWYLELKPSTSQKPGKTLEPTHWTDPSKIWTSATPIILDRHPKPHFKKDPAKWAESCQKIIQKSCERAGLPIPVSVTPSLYSQTHGVAPAAAFPAPESRNGHPQRFHIHAVITFDEPVSGPLLVGAGRYRGYGLMLPINEGTSNQATS